MNFTVKKSNRKTISLIVRDGAVLVRAPHHVNQDTIEQFVKSKQDWIQKKLLEYRPMGFDLNRDAVIRIFGNSKSLTVIQSSTFKIEESDKTITIYKPNSMSDKKVEDYFDLHFRHKLEAFIQPRLDYYCKALNIKKPPFMIRRYQRLYGRCSSKGDLAFNLYMYHDTFDFINYVILHECAHLIEFNHSKRFYAVIESIMPNYKDIIALNKYSSNLHPDQ